MTITKLNEQMIERLASSQAVYKRGVSYYRKGQVDNLYYNNLFNSYNAQVYGTHLYDVEIKMKDSDHIDYMCDCEAAFSYVGACKHVIATLLELQERGVTFPNNRRVSLQKSSLLDEFQSIQNWQQPLLLEKETLQVQFELTVDCVGGYYQHMIDGFQLSLRVGEGRLYVVKDMYEFLKAVKRNEPYIFTNKFAFSPSEHLFLDGDQKVFDLLYILLSIEEYRTNSYRPNKRYIEVPPVYLQPLLEALKKQSFTLMFNGYPESLEPITIQALSNDEELFSFSLVEREDIVEINGNVLPGVLFAEEEYRVALKNNTIYQLNEEQAKALDILSNEIEPNEAIDFVPKDQLESFCSQVLPQLSRYGSIQMDERLEEKVDSKPLKASLKIDFEEEALTLELLFQYGNEKRNPFAAQKKESTETILVREVEKEQLILHLLEQSLFTVKDSKLVLVEMEEIVVFLYEQLPKLQPYAELFLTNDARKLLFQPVSTPTVSIDVDGESNWLDVSFSIEGISEDEIVSVLRSLYEKKKYHRLSNGAFLHLEEEQFHSIAKAVDSLGGSAKEVGQQMRVPLHKAFALDQNKAGTKLSKKLHRLIQDVTSPEYSEWAVPKELEATLRTYQETGYRWIHTLSKAGLGGILADDMGLGKTLQMITHLQAGKEEGQTDKSMIIAPASVIYNWEKEIKRFAPMLKVAVVAGNKAERDHIRGQAYDADVWITSYPLIQRDFTAYAEMMFQTLILDEAQAIKNDQAKTTKAVRSLKAASRFALSGTPIENRLEELFSLIETVLPGLLGTKKQFNELSNEHIAKRIRPFIIRRLKKEVLTELPDKIETVQYTDLLPEQKKYYLAQVKQLKSDVDDAISSNQFQKKRIEILAGLTKLRQLCCHPKLVTDDNKAESGKLIRLMEYVEEGLAAGQRMVIFSQFTSMLALIKEEFDKRGWSYFSLDGQTPSSERVKLADQFNEGENNLFLISLKAGGTGLNLTGGDTVILYDTWWNPAIEEQAADRVYRFGQTKNVQVIKLIANGTIEEKILALHEKKKALFDSVIQPGEQTISSLTAEEIKELLMF
ncbi:SNF2 helicase associated domain-containing protein [Alkalihalobacillus oceani]|uniref:DEAD/DEAH box helicase n=1 Tax=Halalkalibacter oceani TaxID=1653776 RepID=UPI0020404554|nr:SNF2 helicase associated domain-containing protein [Halalkalibacter oceani]MCM3762852.1 SNF2 helicase associated domain-containing protein [Halalkalibacter oceani]